jgi:hypothetical protein
MGNCQITAVRVGSKAIKIILQGDISSSEKISKAVK